MIDTPLQVKLATLERCVSYISGECEPVGVEVQRISPLSYLIHIPYGEAD